MNDGPLQEAPSVNAPSSSDRHDPANSDPAAASTASGSTTLEPGPTNTEAAVPADPAPADNNEAVITPAGEGDVSELTAPPANTGFVHSETETFTDIRDDDKETLAYLGEPKEAELAYTYQSHMDPNRQVDPHGVYLDDVERRNAELARAKVEDRDPDLENPPATCSTPLVPTIAAQANAVGGVVAPVDSYESISVGVEDVTNNAAAAEAQGLNPDGTEKDSE